MNSLNLKHLALHTLGQTTLPDTDSAQWLAYQTLKVLYPDISCLSHNGYHCDGLADYTIRVSFCGSRGFIDLESGELLYESDKPFHEMTTNEIVKAWMRVVGETETTKKGWLNKLWSR